MTSPRVTATLQNDRGIWVIRGRIFNPITGETKQCTKSTHLKVKDCTKKQAKQILSETRDQWQEEVDGVTLVNKKTLSAYARQFIGRKRDRRNIRENTLKSYNDYFETHIEPGIGRLSISELTLKDLEEFYSEYLKTHRVSSARKLNVVISGAMKEAIKEGTLQHNLAEDVEFPRGEKYSGSSVYTPGEVKTLLDAAKEAGEPIRAAITLAVCYGLRRSEVLGLRWKDVDLARGVLTVSNTITQNGALRIESEQTKTAKSHRTIALLDATVPYLSELKQQQKDSGMKLDKVVAWSNGQPVRPDYVSRKTMQVMQRCGLPVIRFHDLRHTAASLLAPYVTPKQLQEFLGHEDISTTFDIYTHVMDQQKKETSMAMNRVLLN